MIDLDFKIEHNTVWANEKFYIIKMTASDIDDVLHMFIECDDLSLFREF